MNAPSKVAAKKDAETNDNMALWHAVETTDPRHTKKVNQRGGFTAIGANYQIMKATEQWGPLGIGWGYDASDPLFHDSLVFVSVTLWHGDRTNRFGPVHGGAEWKSPKGHLDSDAPKKAGTDGLTKLLSQLGFNADVFLGRFDDNKYVASLQAEIDRAEKGEPEKESRGKKFPEGPATGIHHLKQLSRPLYRDLAACGDADQLDIVKSDNKALIAQIEAAWPDGWNGIDGDGNKYPGFNDLLSQTFETENA